MRKISLTIFILLGSIMFSAQYMLADVVYFDSNKVEGMIVEETDTAVILQTTIGKVSIQKDKIKKIERLKPEENYVAMGDYYNKQQRYQEAVEYYQKALKENPGYTKAQDALTKAQAAQEELELQRQAEIEQQEEAKERKKNALEQDIGIVIDKVGEALEVTQVTSGSPASRASIKALDRIVTINNVDVKGMTLEKACEELLAGRPIALNIERETKIVIERIEHKERSFLGIGVFLGSYGDSLYVSSVMRGEPADRAGLEVGDIVARINGQSVEKLSPDEAAKLITGEEGTEVSISILKSPQIK